jgi:5,10-methylenetetrahydromethanopterin reductase
VFSCDVHRHLAGVLFAASGRGRRDEPHIADLIAFASSMALTGTVEQVSEKITGLAALGVTELVYQPAGSDIGRELRALASAAGFPSPN